MPRPKKEGPRPEQITVRFKPEVMERIRTLAEAESRPPANFIAWVVCRYVAENPAQEEKARF